MSILKSMGNKIEVILWDFDGVILDSMAVRDFGFREIFKDYPKDQVEELIIYHREQGGLSRYVKIRYFYEEILNQSISDEQIQEYAQKFSDIMRKELILPENLIEDSLTFIKEAYKNYPMHIVSGSDQKELRFLCETLNLSQYFLSIHGSPKPKKEWVAELMSENNYPKASTCLIGDSINDWEAAEANNILFYGYNNNNLSNKGEGYIESFENLRW